MKARSKFIEKNTEDMAHKYYNSCMSVQEVIKIAIELGMENHDLVDEVYSHSISQWQGGPYRFSILKNDTCCVMQSGYIFSSYNSTETAAIAVIKSLEGE